jgi:DNA primase
MDIFELLEDEGIEYWTAGKNVSAGWVNITCPFCDDDSNHLGINLKSFRVKCWRCGSHRIIRLIAEIANCGTIEAKRIYNSLEASAGGVAPPLSVTSSVVKTKGAAPMALPQESTIHFPKIHSEYLRSRGFPPLKTIRKYKLRAVHNLGRYKFRIVIPVFMDRQLVSFTCRDITGQQDPPYKMASKNESLLDRNKVLFNYDSIPIGGNAILVEGPMDVMKLGSNAICGFGVNISMHQMLLLKKKKIRRLFVIFDSPKKDGGVGKRAAKELAPVLAPIVQKRVEIITLKRALDPGELTIEGAKAVKAELGFDI